MARRTAARGARCSGVHHRVFRAVPDLGGRLNNGRETWARGLGLKKGVRASLEASHQ